MSHAIIVENVSKQYRLGQLLRKATLRETLESLILRPFRRESDEKDILWALQDVSFKVRQGEVLGIIGRNGAGKSTLLKVLSKITYPTSGKIKVNGRIASLLEVGTGFHEELTGRENIYLNGSILGMTKKEIDARLDEIVNFANVEKFIDTPIKRYSSGMRLRLGFAVAAHLEPDILLVDEVLAVGDAEFQKKCLTAMQDLQEVGRTVLFVSHNMAAIENLCPRAIWIDDGRIRQDGDAKSAIKDYLSTFSQIKQAVTDLTNLDSRRGTGEITFKAIEFMTPDKQPKAMICSGDSLAVRLHYQCHKKVSSPHFGLEVYSDLGTMIMSFNTWTTGYQISHVACGENYIDLEIDFVNLMPGRYFVTLWVGREGVLFDHLQHCAIFDVEVADYFKTGKGMESRFGLVFMPCKWALNRVPENEEVVEYTAK